MVPIVLLALAARCSHSPGITPADPCAAEGAPSEVCCQTLTEAADRLLAAGSREPAIAAYRSARDRCVQFAPVRRRLFLALHPDLARAGRTSPVAVQLEASLAPELRPDLRVQSSHNFVDGEPLEAVRGLASGPHLFEAEVYLQSAAGSGPVWRLDGERRFVVTGDLPGGRPARASFTVTARDSGGAAPPPRRVMLALAAALSPSRPALSEPGALPGSLVFLPPAQADQHRITAPARIPALGRTSGSATLKICVGADGAVHDVTVLDAPEGHGLAALVAEVRTWRYRPYLIDQTPVRFCTPFHYVWGRK
jgi:hypothetical protein